MYLLSVTGYDQLTPLSTDAGTVVASRFSVKFREPEPAF
jgi:hypothetical protein